MCPKSTVPALQTADKKSTTLPLEICSCPFLVSSVISLFFSPPVKCEVCLYSRKI